MPAVMISATLPGLYEPLTNSVYPVRMRQILTVYGY